MSSNKTALSSLLRSAKLDTLLPVLDVIGEDEAKLVEFAKRVFPDHAFDDLLIFAEVIDAVAMMDQAVAAATVAFVLANMETPIDIPNLNAALEFFPPPTKPSPSTWIKYNTQYATFKNVEWCMLLGRLDADIKPTNVRACVEQFANAVARIPGDDGFWIAVMQALLRTTDYAFMCTSTYPATRRVTCALCEQALTCTIQGQCISFFTETNKNQHFHSACLILHHQACAAFTPSAITPAATSSS